MYWHLQGIQPESKSVFNLWAKLYIFKRHTDTLNLHSEWYFPKMIGKHNFYSNHFILRLFFKSNQKKNPIYCYKYIIIVSKEFEFLFFFFHSNQIYITITFPSFLLFFAFINLLKTITCNYILQSLQHPAVSHNSNLKKKRRFWKILPTQK